MRKFVLRSTIVRMALLSLSTIKPISSLRTGCRQPPWDVRVCLPCSWYPEPWSHACTGGCGDTSSCVGSLRQAYCLRRCRSSCKWSREISSHPPLPSSRISVWETIAPQWWALLHARRATSSRRSFPEHDAYGSEKGHRPCPRLLYGSVSFVFPGRLHTFAYRLSTGAYDNTKVINPRETVVSLFYFLHCRLFLFLCVWRRTTLSLRTKNVRFQHGGQLLRSPIKKLHFYLECLLSNF